MLSGTLLQIRTKLCINCFIHYLLPATKFEKVYVTELYLKFISII
jgi:hypothetical protein